MSDSSIVTFHLVGNDGDGPYFYNFYSPEDCVSPIDLTEVRQVVGPFQFLAPEPTVPFQDVESFIFSVSKGEPPHIQALMMSYS